MIVIENIDIQLLYFGLVHLGGGLTGVLLAPIFVEYGLIENGQNVGGIVYGGSSLSFKVSLLRFMAFC